MDGTYSSLLTRGKKLIDKSKLCVLLYVISILIISSCSIEKFPESLSEPEGSIHVEAFDSNDDPILGASIFIDDIERPEKTPAFIHGIVEGLHDVEVKKFGYWSYSSNVEVIGGDTISIGPQLDVIPDGLSGYFTVNSEPEGARVLVDGRTFLVEGEPVFTPVTVELPWSNYDISVYKTGFTTQDPIFPRVEINAGDTSTISFILASGEIGGSSDMIPFDFILENETEDSVRLSDLTGQVVLINFWYADCVPCMNEFPYIETVYREYANRGFNVLGINPMFPDGREEVIQVREQLGLTFQLLLDWDRHVSVTQYNVNPYPRNILVDRTGRISVVLQSVEEDELRELVKELIDTTK